MPNGAQLGGFRVAYAVFLFGVFAYFMPGATWNPTSRFDLVRAIVEEQTLHIDDYVEDTGDRAFHDGHWYTDKAPLPALLAAPAYAVFLGFEHLGGQHPEFSATSTPTQPAQHLFVNASFARGLYVCSLSTAGIAGAVIGVLLFELLRRTHGATTALLASATTVLATPVLAYSTSFYGHVVAGAFLLGAYVASRDRPTPRRLAVAGLCLASAVGCEYIVAAPAALLGIVIVLEAPRGDRVRAASRLALGAALPVAVVAAYHTACFGAPWRTGYSFVVRPEFASGHAHGLLGIHAPDPVAFAALMFGRFRGLGWVAPITIVGLVATIVAGARRRSREALVPLAVFVVLWLVNAGYYMWWGGAAAGPRHLVPVVPFLGVGVAAAFSSRRAWPVAAVAAIASATSVLVLTAVGLEAPEHGDVLFGYAFPQFVAGHVAHLAGASNLGLRMGLAPSATLGPPMAWIVVGLGTLLRALRGATSLEEVPA